MDDQSPGLHSFVHYGLPYGYNNNECVLGSRSCALCLGSRSPYVSDRVRMMHRLIFTRNRLLQRSGVCYLSRMKQKTGKTTTAERSLIPLHETPVLRPWARSWDGPFYRTLVCGRTRAVKMQEDQDFSLSIIEPLRMFLMTLEGEGVYRITNRSHRLAPGIVLALPVPSRGYLCRRPEGMPWTYIWANFCDSRSFEFFDYIVGRFGSLQGLSVQSEVAVAATRLVHAAEQQPRRSPYEWSALTFDLLNTWLADCERRHLARRRPLHTSTRPLQRIPLTVKSLASELGYSRAHVSRKLSRQWKAAPGQLLRASRLDEAARRLSSETTSIARIAADTGYASCSSFAHAFRRRFGVNPGHYRRAPMPNLGCPVP